MKANGTSQIQLTKNGVDDGDPDWSPNGARIAFSERFGRGGDGEIETMKADGSALAVLTANDAEDTQPAWSPGSKKIAFTSDRDGNPEVFVMNADGSGEKQLTSGGSVDRDPTWLSSVPAIGFASDRGGAPQIFTMTAGGAGQALLTDVLSNARLPDWHWNPLLDSLPEVPASFAPQQLWYVIVTPHGHFVEVDLHQQYAADKTRVELWQGNSLKGLQTGSGPAKTSWHIQVDHLKPHQAYALWIVMKDPIHGGWQYKSSGTVKTLRRDVTVTYESVDVIYDGDDGVSGCGEFVFRLHAGAIGKAPRSGLKSTTSAAGTPGSTRPSSASTTSRSRSCRSGCSAPTPTLRAGMPTSRTRRSSASSRSTTRSRGRSSPRASRSPPSHPSTRAAARNSDGTATTSWTT